MDLWQWIFFSFNGRISRKYYWYTVVILSVLSFIIAGIVFGFSGKAITSGDLSSVSFIGWIVYVIFAIFAVWVGLAVSIKRWHDRNKSGWWVLIGLIPVIGEIWVLIECGFLPGTEGVNAYGVENQLPTDPFQGVGTPEAPLEKALDADPLGPRDDV